MRQRPTLAEGDRARLAAIFDADLAELSAWIGRPIRCGTFVDAALAAPLEWTAETRREFPAREAANAA